MLEAAQIERENLKKQLEGRFLFLKFDCATRIRTNYLALNARYVSPVTGLPTTCTLSVVDTHSRHSAKDLKEMVVKVLDDFNLPLDHIAAAVSDNAANMITLVAKMNEVKL